MTNPTADYRVQRAKDGRNCEHVLVTYKDLDRQPRMIVIPAQTVQLKTQLFAKLAENGFFIPLDKAGQADLLMRFRQPEQSPIRLLHQTGFFDNGAGYVFKDGRTLGSDDARKAHFDGPEKLPSDAILRGSLAPWQEAVAKIAMKSKVLRLALSASFVPLINWPEDVFQSFALHLFSAHSSIGKTTASKLALSVHSRASQQDISSWNHTPTALEELAASNNGRLLVLDEIGHVSGDKKTVGVILQQTSFLFGDGKGRTRSRRYAGLVSETWKIVGISSGEISLKSLSEGHRFGGEMVRTIDIPIDNIGDGRIFPEKLNKRTASAVISHATEVIQEHYGQPANLFITAYLKDTAAAKKHVDRAMAKYLADYGPTASGLELRFSNRFAMIYAAASLAISFGILPWKAKSLRADIIACHREAWSYAQGVPPLEARLRQILAAILAEVRAGELKDQAGIVKTNAKRYLAIELSLLNERLGLPPTSREASATLARLGLVDADGEGKRTRPIKVKGTTKRTRRLMILVKAI